MLVRKSFPDGRRRVQRRRVLPVREIGDVIGLFTDIKGQLYVNLHGVKTPSKTDEETNPEKGAEVDDDLPQPPAPDLKMPPAATPTGLLKTENRRVFISHGKKRAFVDSLKELLSFGELEPLVATENESVSQPVPDKVMNDMRRCSAAIIHVDSEQKMISQEGEQKSVLNPNVLIEIGAAMALYGRRFILLVREGAVLPSNLQGLYEVRYQGDKLDADVTIKLLKAIRDIKNHPLSS
jgi:predicted nucleotide-binding protein